MPTIAAALEIEEEPSVHIGDRRMLLVLDNFEQVVDGAAEVGALVDASPNLDALITSREPLHLSRERVVSVVPLEEVDAVQLFLERACAVGADLQLGSGVAEICRKVDGLPLAIELAASRVNALSISTILEHLDTRLSFLAGGPRDAPERQQTLRATISWSYGLLATDEQRLFARLGVFAAGCTLNSAQAVCAAQIETLASLVDKNLLRRRDERYWMLETIREYALERLHEQEEFDIESRALAEYMATRGEEASHLLEGLGGAAGCAGTRGAGPGARSGAG